ncbi:hypothetical protein JG688_00013809 [Phytophthora aleatoria]|uniref:Uncharacterized protein n=1 Tax=Phytophthora aleatoria TaxID=2496075 RepID=A0A8J5J1A2_9STRA|nr:hypothetical protein JG688_00013809 [Phytophthora aleatoria]
MGVNYFSLLRRAARDVNKKMENHGMMIFVVLTDPTSQFYQFLPPLFMDESSRVNEETSMELFPPFVLTYNMDVLLKQLPGVTNLAYKALVFEKDARKLWTTLVSMGRPLWQSYAELTADHVRREVYLAASKLLGGLSPIQKTSYENKDAMQGVASMLCRLGLRPRSNSAFASRVVANLMGVLH